MSLQRGGTDAQYSPTVRRPSTKKSTLCSMVSPGDRESRGNEAYNRSHRDNTPGQVQDKSNHWRLAWQRLNSKQR